MFGVNSSFGFTSSFSSDQEGAKELSLLLSRGVFPVMEEVTAILSEDSSFPVERVLQKTAQFLKEQGSGFSQADVGKYVTFSAARSVGYDRTRAVQILQQDSSCWKYVLARQSEDGRCGKDTNRHAKVCNKDRNGGESTNQGSCTLFECAGFCAIHAGFECKYYSYESTNAECYLWDDCKDRENNPGWVTYSGSHGIGSDWTEADWDLNPVGNSIELDQLQLSRIELDQNGLDAVGLGQIRLDDLSLDRIKLDRLGVEFSKTCMDKLGAVRLDDGNPNSDRIVQWVRGMHTDGSAKIASVGRSLICACESVKLDDGSQSESIAQSSSPPFTAFHPYPSVPSPLPLALYP